VEARLDDGRPLAGRVERADTFLARFRGWMLRRPPGPGEAILLAPCDSIHTCFMRFPIDILFLDPEGRVVRRFDGVAPWKYVPPVAGAASVLELPAGALAPPPAGPAPGDRIRFGESPAA